VLAINHRKRSAKHLELQGDILATDVRPRDDGMEVQEASVKTASTYLQFYNAVGVTTRPRKALSERIDIELEKGKPVITQGTPGVMSAKVYFDAKVQRLVTQRRADGDPISHIEASKIVSARAIQNGTFREEDMYGHKYNDDDQMRAMFDPNFAAHSVPTSSIVVRRS